MVLALGRALGDSEFHKRNSQVFGMLRTNEQILQWYVWQGYWSCLISLNLSMQVITKFSCASINTIEPQAVSGTEDVTALLPILTSPLKTSFDSTRKLVTFFVPASVLRICLAWQEMCTHIALCLV
eukprot:495747-Amphidinium_carterae.1